MTYEELYNAMKNKFYELAGYEADDASDVGLRFRVLAGELRALYAAADVLETQNYARTARGEALDRHAEERGILRRGESYAAGTLRFERAAPLWYNAEIPQGTVCSTKGEPEVRFVTTQKAVLPQGEVAVEAPARAETAGRLGNAAANSVTQMVTPPAGLQTVNNPQPFAGGEDAEGDEPLRARLMQSWAGLPNGANAAFYRDLVLRRPQVRSAHIVPRENGAGTVGIYLRGYGALEEELLEKIRAEVESLREINVQIHLANAKEVTVPVDAKLTPLPGVSFAKAKEECARAVRDFFAALEVGEPVVTNALGAALFATGTLRNYSVVSPGNLGAAVKPDEVAVCGALSLRETGAAP